MRRLCFFFQAEDGIRYLTVTGVQTCALPISGRSRAAQSTSLQRHASNRRREVPPSEKPSRSRARFCRTRSEERRVGKECRYGWSQYRFNIKNDVYWLARRPASTRLRALTLDV